MTDLLLSSGFLAFARHAGVLLAVEEESLAVDAIVGTSSGALVGALWAAGLPAPRIVELVASRRPLRLLRPHLRPWDGVFHLGPLITWLRELLPPTFAELPRPFAAGVFGPDRTPRLLTRGALPEAVAASCAIPWLFRPVEHEGVRYRDGGLVDRVMVEPWRTWRGQRAGLAHIVDRTGGAETVVSGLPIIRTPRSGANFWSLGDVPAAAEVARRAALEVLRRGPEVTAER